jgi:tRNA(Ile)-lysidine synthase
MTTRPRLTPAIADVRRAVRLHLAEFVAQDSVVRSFGAHPPAAFSPNAGDRAVSELESPAPRADSSAAPALGKISAGRPLVLVALSGGPDSLALAAATAFEAPRAGLRAGAVIVDHGLQPGSADAAAQAARQAEALGLNPVLSRSVVVGTDGGPEAAARTARYAALAAAAEETGAVAVLLGHTLDDQAETVLLGLARGSGAGSLKGMVARGELYGRPLLGIRRSTIEQFCADAGLEPWHDPQNLDESFTRVRVRRTVLPLLERELGPGVVEALGRTAAQLREDAEALDHFAEEGIEELAEHAEAGISLPVKALAANPAALLHRIIRLAVDAEFGVSLSRTHTLEVARLVTEWRGQGPLDLPGVRVERRGALILFSAHSAPVPAIDREP